MFPDLNVGLPPPDLSVGEEEFAAGDRLEHHGSFGSGLSDVVP